MRLHARRLTQNPFAVALLVFFCIAVAALIGRQIPSVSASTATIVWQATKCSACALFLNPDSPELRFAIGNYYFGGGAYDLDRAEEHYQATLALQDPFPGARYQLARVFFIRGSLKRALIEINKELETYPDNQRSYYIRGLINGYDKRLTEAAADFKKFIAWKPDTWAGYNDLAWIYFEKGDFASVRDTARAGLANNPDNPWLLNSLGVALLNLQDKGGAKEAFTKALTLLNSMTEESWGRAYPGNDPADHADGFAAMREFIQQNLKLLETVDITSSG
jgi:tetratricopeptide (TPR) repeat protein